MTDSVPDDLGAAPTLRALAAGETLSDRYVLEACVGAGSMGEVWRATDGALGVTVALKVLPPVLGRDERSVKQLKSEVTRTRGLVHQNIVSLYDFGQDAKRGVSFLTMEFVDGKTVDRLVRDRGGGLPVEEVLKWGRDVASALDHAHEKKLLHRDVKPSNVMVDGGAGLARALPAGWARVRGDEGDAAAASRSGATVGSFGVRSPRTDHGSVAGDGHPRRYRASQGVQLHQGRSHPGTAAEAGRGVSGLAPTAIAGPRTARPSGDRTRGLGAPDSPGGTREAEVR